MPALSTATTRPPGLALVRSGWALKPACGLVVLSAIAVVGALLSWANRAVGELERECAGVQLIRPLVALQVNLPDFAPTESDRRSRIDSALEQFFAHPVAHDPVLRLSRTQLNEVRRTGSSPEEIAELWRRIRQDNRLTTLDLAGGKADLERRIPILIEHVGETSSLIYDGMLDTHCLMESVVVFLPEHFLRLGDITRGTASGRDAGLLNESDLFRVARAREILRQDDVRLERPTTPGVQRYERAVEEYRHVVTQLAATLSGERSDRLDAGPARVAAWDLWRAAADELEARLDARIAKLKQQRAWSVLAALLGAAACLFVVVRVLRQELRLSRQAAELDQARVQLDTDSASRRFAEARSQLVVESSIDAVIMADARGTITDWNRTAEKIFGWRKDEVLGQRLSDTIIPPRLREAHERGLRRFIETGVGSIVNTRVEVPALRRNGVEFPIEVTFVPMLHDGSYLFHASLRDITAVKAAKDELVAAKVEAERNRDGLERALAHAMDMAEEAKAGNKAKSEFLAVMSHEIRTPLNGVLGLGELLLSSELSAQQRQWATTLKSSGDTLLTIINDILDFSKIEAGHMELERAPFDPRRIAHEVHECLTPNAVEKQLRFSCEIAPAVPPGVKGDANRFRQVLMNLASNALKFTTDGEVAIELSWGLVATTPTTLGGAGSALPTDVPQLTVRVRDTGIGLSPGQVSRLFQSFTQADSSTTRRFGGTGLGLAICKRLVELMGGQIGLESLEGRGSTFWFHLPLPVAIPTLPSAPDPVATRVATLPVAPEAVMPADIAPPVTTPSRAAEFAGLKVLLTDDSPTNVLLARALLDRLGCVTTVAENGQQALEQLHHGSFELVLMDCSMPVLDGYEATRELRRREVANSTPRIPVIAVTANAVKGDREKCLAAGMDDYLTKPIRRTDFENVIRRWVRPVARSISA